MNIYYDTQGRSITLEKWSELFGSRWEDDDRWWQVGHDTVNGVDISTVWIGLDLTLFGGPPLIFESMVFDDGGETHRYATWEQALEGHKLLVLRNTPLIPDFTANYHFYIEDVDWTTGVVDFKKKEETKEKKQREYFKHECPACGSILYCPISTGDGADQAYCIGSKSNHSSLERIQRDFEYYKDVSHPPIAMVYVGTEKRKRID